MWLFEEFNVPSSSSRIAIVGSGAIGSFYRLIPARAGFEVNFLPRSEHQAVAKHAHSGRGLLMIGETPYE
jgi:ketopantoate reductase